MGNAIDSTKKSCLSFFVDRFLKSDLFKLISAIKRGDLSKVKHYHQMNFNFSQYLENGDTPLHFAVKHNQFIIVKFLVDHIPTLNLNDKNFLGDTPLFIAVLKGNLQMVEYLIKKSADLNIQENKGFTPFMAACSHGDLGLVKLLVSYECDYKIKSFDGQTGLHRAAFYGNLQVVKYLVKVLRMNASLPDKKGNLPIHYASLKLNISCIRILIKASRSAVTEETLYTKNRDGVMPIEILIRNLNRLREKDDLKMNFDTDQIEDYIFNKNHPPHFKINEVHSKKSSRRVSIFDIIRSQRSARNPPLLKFSTVSEHEKMSPDSPGVRSPTYLLDARDSVREDEEVGRFKKQLTSWQKIAEQVQQTRRSSLKSSKTHDFSALDRSRTVKLVSPRMNSKFKEVLQMRKDKRTPTLFRAFTKK